MQAPSMLQGESLKRLLQGAAAGAVVTMFVGFYWGGWSLGSTADKMAKERSELAVVAALAPVCADKFRALPDHLFEEAERCFRRSRTNLKMRFELEARGNMFMVKAVELDIKLRKIANDNYTVSTRGDDGGPAI